MFDPDKVIHAIPSSFHFLLNFEWIFFMAKHSDHEMMESEPSHFQYFQLLF